MKIYLKLVLSYLRVHWLLFFVGLAAGSAFIFLFPTLSRALQPPKVNRVALVGNYTAGSLPLKIQNEISLGLTKLLPDGHATGSAALDWQTADSGKTVIFNLAQNLFWQDGTKFDTSQINYSLKGVEVKRLSLYRLEFKFKESFSPLPTILSQPLFKNALIGLGDNAVENIKFNGRFIASLTLKNLPTGAQKIYKFYPTEEAAVTALKLGAVNHVEDLHQTYGLQNDSHLKVQGHISENTIATILLNLHKDPISEKSFRQALAYALPDSYPHSATASSSLPQNSWAKSLNFKTYPQNQTLAKKTFADVASASATKRIFLSSPKELTPLAESISAAWSSLGLEAKTTVSEIIPPSFDAHLLYLEIPPDPDQYALWHSTQAGNTTGYKSFKADHLLEDGRRTLGDKERWEIYQAFQKALSEDLPAIFLFYPQLYDVSRI